MSGEDENIDPVETAGATVDAPAPVPADAPVTAPEAPQPSPAALQPVSITRADFDAACVAWLRDRMSDSPVS